MDRNNLNWDCDRKAKCDFTASTVNYWRERGAEGQLRFWEATSAATLVPFGDNRAYPQSRFDVYFSYDDRIWYAVEIKERTRPSDYERTIEEGAFMNKEKKDLIQPLKDKGYIPIWCELYPDGVIRVWNLKKIDVDSLPTTTASIKRITIDPDSKKKPQLRFLLPVSAATIYSRIDDKQRNS